jgi:hypothetical protein
MPYKNKEDMYAAQERTRDRNHAKMWELLENSQCADCSIEDSRVLEFDHRPSEDKSFNVSRAVSGSTRSWELIQKEIDKCDIVCANCHRIRTMARGNHKRHKSSNTPL